MASTNMGNTVAGQVRDAARTLCARVNDLRFALPVAYTYNPLVYARALHEQYIDRFVDGPRSVLIVGMNPGPFGMAQTGVPFGEVGAVTSWMKLAGHVGRPAQEHPKRPVLGLACARKEVSGARLWGAIQKLHPDPRTFFADHFVLNYCPLLFLDEGGKNLTPDKLPLAERAPLEAACDEQLRAVASALVPVRLIGVGGWAAKRVERALGASVTKPVGVLPHPSPASPQANRGWDALARQALVDLGVQPFL